MNKKQKIIIITIILSLVLLFSGLTYAYFTSQTNNESGSTIVVKGGTMNITYANGSGDIIMENIYPRDKEWVNKTFTVTGDNTTELEMDYRIYLQTTSNSFNQKDLTASISGTSTNTEDTLVTKTDISIPVKGKTLLGRGVFTSKTATHNYSLKIYYKETGENQNNGQDKTYTGYVTLDSGNELSYDCLIEQEQTPSTTEISTFNSPYHRDQFESVIFNNTREVPSNALDSWDVSNNQNGSVMAYILDEDNDNLYELYIGQEGGVVANPNSARLFNYFTKVTKYDLTYFDTSKVTTMLLMFNKNFSLETIDISNFKTSNVTDLSALFQVNTKLTEIKGLTNLDVSNVTSLSNAFKDCTNLKSLDITGWNTSKVEAMAATFDNCSSLEEIKGLEDIDTSNVTTMRFLFNHNVLKSLDLSKWNTSNVTNFLGIFNVSKITDLSSIANLDTSKVTNMQQVFRYVNYETIDISGWINNSNLLYTNFMFNHATIKNLYMNKLSFDSVTSHLNMFESANITNIYVKDEAAKTWIEARLAEVNKTANVQIAN